MFHNGPGAGADNPALGPDAACYRGHRRPRYGRRFISFSTGVFLRRTVLTAALIPCALVLTACGSKSATTAAVSSSSASSASASGPSNAGLSQTQLFTRFKAALGTVTAIHYKGTMAQGDSSSGSTASAASGSADSSVSLDLQINKDGSAQGTIVTSGMTIPLITTGGATYVQVTPSFESEIKSEAGSDASVVSSIVVGKWISSKTSIGSSLAGSFDDFANFSQMTSQLASPDGDTFTYLGTSTLNGQQVAQYNDDGSSSGGPANAVMSIPLHGLSLPIEENAGSQGVLTFTWNEPTTVSPPPAADILNLP